MAFETKDSGERQDFAGGMVRDMAEGKLRPDLITSGPMYLRWVELMTRGAVKYDANNWMLAAGVEEYDRFLESAFRHFTVWYFWRRFGINLEEGAEPGSFPTEDHAAAVFFNINGLEYVVDQSVLPLLEELDEVLNRDGGSQDSTGPFDQDAGSTPAPSTTEDEAVVMQRAPQLAEVGKGGTRYSDLPVARTYTPATKLPVEVIDVTEEERFSEPADEVLAPYISEGDV